MREIRRYAHLFGLKRPSVAASCGAELGDRCDGMGISAPTPVGVLPLAHPGRHDRVVTAQPAGAEEPAQPAADLGAAARGQARVLRGPVPGGREQCLSPVGWKQLRRAPSCGDLMVEPSEPCHREALAAARGPVGDGMTRCPPRAVMPKPHHARNRRPNARSTPARSFRDE